MSALSSGSSSNFQATVVPPSTIEVMTELQRLFPTAKISQPTDWSNNHYFRTSSSKTGAVDGGAFMPAYFIELPRNTGEEAAARLRTILQPLVDHRVMMELHQDDESKGDRLIIPVQEINQRLFEALQAAKS